MSRSAIQRICNQAIAVVARISLVLGGVALLALTIMFTLIIISRPLEIHLPGADDIAVILLAGSFTFGFAYVMSIDDHLSVEILTMHLKGRAGTVVRFLILAVTIMVVALIINGLSNMFVTAVKNGMTMPSSLPIPRAIPIGFVLLGAAMFEIVMILRFIERLAAGTYPQPVKQIETE